MLILFLDRLLVFAKLVLKAGNVIDSCNSLLASMLLAQMIMVPTSCQSFPLARFIVLVRWEPFA